MCYLYQYAPDTFVIGSKDKSPIKSKFILWEWTEENF